MTIEIFSGREIDMESSDFLRALIQSKQGEKFKTLSELAEKSGVNQGNLSSFMKPEGDPRRRENITFDSAWKILKFLGVSFSSGCQYKPESTTDTDEQSETLKWEKAQLLGQVNLLKDQLKEANTQIRALERQLDRAQDQLKNTARPQTQRVALKRDAEKVTQIL